MTTLGKTATIVFGGGLAATALKRIALGKDPDEASLSIAEVVVTSIAVAGVAYWVTHKKETAIVVGAIQFGVLVAMSELIDRMRAAGTLDNAALGLSALGLAVGGTVGTYLAVR